MPAKTLGLKRVFPFVVIVSLTLILLGSSPDRLNAQSPAPPAVEGTAKSGQLVDTRVVLGPLPLPPPEQTPPVVTGSGAGLTITPTFDASIDSTTQTVINNAIAFYQNTFSNNITVNI